MPSVRAIVVCMAMLALVTSLASRTVHLPNSDVTSFQSNALSAKIQHRNTNAARWMPTVPAVLLAWSPTPIEKIAVQDEPLRSIFVDAGLNTRPPPQS
ncbi:MAG TPA: hypothetical protein VE994_18650 [Terriglobales bacterium]|nr:hypothetical protein [Terriglobales bacterium]